MANMEFTDGVEIDTSGPLRTLRIKDGWYVVGEGYLIPCSSYEDAKAELENMLTPPKTEEEKRAEVEKFLEEKGFFIDESGGHCLWATKKTLFKGKEAFFALTDEGGTDYPHSIEETVLFGIYDMDGENLAEGEFDSLKAALAEVEKVEKEKEAT